MFKNDWPVVPADVRPARPDGTCFYCATPLGQQHRMGCVIRSKTVVVEVTFRVIREVPEDWDADAIEFQMNESSSCQDNLANQIADMTDNTEGRCLCGQAVGKFIREASAADVEELWRTPIRNEQ